MFRAAVCCCCFILSLLAPRTPNFNVAAVGILDFFSLSYLIRRIGATLKFGVRGVRREQAHNGIDFRTPDLLENAAATRNPKMQFRSLSHDLVDCS